MQDVAARLTTLAQQKCNNDSVYVGIGIKNGVVILIVYVPKVRQATKVLPASFEGLAVYVHKAAKVGSS